jgi:hypothetical protein
MILRRGVLFLALAAALVVTGILPSTADPGSGPAVQQEVAGQLGLPFAPDVGPAPLSDSLPSIAATAMRSATLPMSTAPEVAAVSCSKPGAGTLLCGSRNDQVMAASEVGGWRVAGA